MVNVDSSGLGEPEQSTPVRLTRIYILKDPRDGAVRYVGKTVGTINNRRREHIRVATTPSLSGHKARNAKWIRKLLTLGLEPLIEQIDSATDDWAQREAWWIACYRASGARLTNTTNGGEGVPGYRFSLEARAAKKALMSTPEAKAAMSEFATRLWSVEGARERYSAAMRAAKTTPQARLASSEMMKRRWTDPEYREKCIAGMNSPESKAKHIASVKAAKATPDQRKVASERSKETWSDHRIRQRRIEGTRAAMQTAQYKDALSVASKASWEDPAVRKRRVDGTKAALERHDVKEKMSEAARNRMASLEGRAALARARAKRWAAYRAAQELVEGGHSAGG